MTNYFVKRLLLLIFVLFGVVTLVFFLIHLIPGDPVDIMLGDTAVAADKLALRHDLGLDQPVMQQYGRYLGHVVQGDLGVSIHSRAPVLGEIMARFPASAELMIGAMVVAMLIAFPLGILAALKPHGLLDASAMFFSFLGIAMPHFWLGPLLIILFSIQLNWLPVNGRGTLAHLVLPAITLGTAMAAMLSRMIRASLLDVLGEDYIRTARAKGLPERTVVLRHALRNALVPVITVIGLQVGVLLSGAIITEAIFDWPGLGTLLLDGISTRNYPLVQGCILFIATIYVLVNMLTDTAYGWADPRVRVR
ncbi:MAG: glutathione ABC transporter permease GsiC [Deltaproteobacteria bacterium CG23_combo_of_CG06-09_8_20_14_all_60_8]|nr:MAG: glutathione ABC transporter permease GsiC [Deltaproteobacteria bacterium CG23_combo_of_CG06-09_8_20_14_all_60_8]